MVQANDLSRSVVPFEQSSTLIAVIEMGAKSRLVAASVPGIERQPLKKLEPDAAAVLRLIERWRSEAIEAGRTIARIVVAYEAGRDGFWLARRRSAWRIEVHVIHSAMAVLREERAKTDRLDAAMLMRVLLGWLRGERGHCGMVAIPTLEEEEAWRPSRERESLVGERSRIINRMKSALAGLGIRGFKAHLRKATNVWRRCAHRRTRAASEHPRRVPARYGAAGAGARADCRNRKGTDRAALARPRHWPARDGAAARQGHHIAIVTPTCWCRKFCRGNCVIAERWRATPGSRARR